MKGKRLCPETVGGATVGRYRVKSRVLGLTQNRRESLYGCVRKPVKVTGRPGLSVYPEGRDATMKVA
jgi:hypothetical protein